jgi:Neurotransmitter-gated ion-channel ligand binding domain
MPVHHWPKILALTIDYLSTFQIFDGSLVGHFCSHGAYLHCRSVVSITLNHNQFDRLWTPDLFVRNLKNGVFHQITVPNRMIRLSPDGTVLYSQRLTLTLACDMQLDKYPMDNQTCNIEFGSCEYSKCRHYSTDGPPTV